MFMNILSFLAILFLIGINGVTDASNAISTIVCTKVLSYRKACTLSAIFNMMGTLGMYYMNHSVTNTIGEIVPIPENSLGLKIIMVAILCTIFFSILSLLKGVPASESYGLIFGLVGAGIATMGLSAINLEKMKLVFWGILFSIVSSVILTKVVNMLVMPLLKCTTVEKVKKMQLLTCVGLSFAHGAQDGLKFIGILKVYERIVSPMEKTCNEFLVVMLCAITLAIGTMIGGRKIVMTVGKKLTQIDNCQAFVSEIGTITTLLIGNFLSFPLSTSHVKTISTVCVGEKGTLNHQKLKEMIITWIVVLPACGLMAYGLMNSIF